MPCVAGALEFHFRNLLRVTRGSFCSEHSLESIKSRLTTDSWVTSWFSSKIHGRTRSGGTLSPEGNHRARCEHSSAVMQTCPGKEPAGLAWCDSLPMVLVSSTTVTAFMTSFWVPKRWKEFQEPSFPEPAGGQAGNPSARLEGGRPPQPSRPSFRCFPHRSLKVREARASGCLRDHPPRAQREWSGEDTQGTGKRAVPGRTR